MSSFEGHISGPLSECNESVTAAMWNIDDLPEEMPTHLRHELGIYSHEPLAPGVPGYDSRRSLLRVIGSEAIEINRDNDDYYKKKLDKGFFGGNL